MELSATALIGFLISIFYFSLAVATIVQANKVKPVKDYANILFGSVFLTFAVALAIFTGRAIFSV